ncbi:unnamed protein product [Rhizophagus irregularis]|nr:unnamed protein product [Rhizophagus irregularis]
MTQNSDIELGYHKASNIEGLYNTCSTFLYNDLRIKRNTSGEESMDRDEAQNFVKRHEGSKIHHQLKEIQSYIRIKISDDGITKEQFDAITKFKDEQIRYKPTEMKPSVGREVAGEEIATDVVCVMEVVKIGIVVQPQITNYGIIPNESSRKVQQKVRNNN